MLLKRYFSYSLDQAESECEVGSNSSYLSAGTIAKSSNVAGYRTCRICTFLALSRGNPYVRTQCSPRDLIVPSEYTQRIFDPRKGLVFPLSQEACHDTHVATLCGTGTAQDVPAQSQIDKRLLDRLITKDRKVSDAQ